MELYTPEAIKGRIDRERFARALSCIVDPYNQDHFKPYMSNEGDDSGWVLDYGKDWRLYFRDDPKNRISVIFHYQCPDVDKETPLAKWLECLFRIKKFNVGRGRENYPGFELPEPGTPSAQFSELSPSLLADQYDPAAFLDETLYSKGDFFIKATYGSSKSVPTYLDMMVVVNRLNGVDVHNVEQGSTKDIYLLNYAVDSKETTTQMLNTIAMKVDDKELRVRFVKSKDEEAVSKVKDAVLDFVRRESNSYQYSK